MAEPLKVKVSAKLPLRTFTVTVKGMGAVDREQRRDNLTAMKYCPGGGVEAQKTFSTAFWVTATQPALESTSIRPPEGTLRLP